MSNIAEEVVIPVVHIKGISWSETTNESGFSKAQKITDEQRKQEVDRFKPLA